MRLDLEGLIRFDESKPSVRTLAESGHSRLLLICLKKGQIVRDHKSASQVMAHFIRGKGAFVTDGVAEEAGPGCTFLVEPNHFHRIHADDDCVVLVVMTPHPARARYPQDQVDRIISHVDTEG